ncbi:MAG: hypothetical protein U5P41_11085 [Gammaproteobacteria bacterium]|nr:hypothetical protein [Gammaproteobacteria bacterium]
MKSPGSAWILAQNLCDAEALPKLIADASGLQRPARCPGQQCLAFYATPLEQLSDSNWAEMMDVNLKAPLFLARHAAATA